VPKRERLDGMAGTKHLVAWVDEIRAWPEVSPPPEDVVIPPHARDHENTKRGDRIVVLAGDQLGWTGLVRQVQQGSINADMRRLDGTSASSVWHKCEYVGRILKEVPRFEDFDEADTWLTGQLREPVPEWANGTRVIFSSPPHLAVRLGGATCAREWVERYDDLEAEGRITKFMPWWETGAQGYELLVTLDGEPTLIDVAARRIKRLA